MSRQLYVETNLFENRLKNSGYKIDYITDELGLSRQGFAKKRKGITPFKASEVFTLCVLLGITADDREKIFYPKVEEEVD